MSKNIYLILIKKFWGWMNSIEIAAKKAIMQYDDKINHFIASSLDIEEKPSLLTRAKLLFWRANIVIQDLGYSRQKISVYKGKNLIAEAEFNIIFP